MSELKHKIGEKKMSELKHKIGDRVRIKSRDWYYASTNEGDGNITDKPDGPSFAFSMIDYCGKKAIIKNILFGRIYKLDIDRGFYSWADFMFEDPDSEELDLTKILKDCPVGTELYTTALGRVSLVNVDATGTMPIIISSKRKICPINLYKNGKATDSPDAECILFPSKDNRDWSTFKAPEKPEQTDQPKLRFKVGDILYNTDNSCIYFVAGMDYKTHNYLLLSESIMFKIKDRESIKGNMVLWPFSSKNFQKASILQIAETHKKQHNKGIHWCRDKAKIVHWYTPFEKILVRYGKDDTWMATAFSNYEKSNDEKEFLTINGSYFRESDILPYEGNEKKLGKVTK